MTATYTNQPGTRNIDTVRAEIDYKDCIPETDAQLSDEEIDVLGRFRALKISVDSADPELAEKLRRGVSLPRSPFLNTNKDTQ